MAASKTLAGELLTPWKAEVASCVETTVEEDTQFENARWLLLGEASECSPSNMADGAHPQKLLTLHIANTEHLTGAGMEREDLGPTMSMFSEVCECFKTIDMNILLTESIN